MRRSLGLNQLSFWVCEVHRGSILCRKDPEDECEWQFCLKKKLEWTKEETRHEQKGDSSAKLECAQWLELKAKSLMPGEMVDANQAKLALAEVTGTVGGT